MESTSLIWAGLMGPDELGPLVTSLVGVLPDPRTTPVPSVDVVFSKPIDQGTFTFGDVALTRDGTVVALNSSVTISLVSRKTYRINGLNNFTAADGTYVVTVSAAGISDLAGNTGTGSHRNPG